MIGFAIAIFLLLLTKGQLGKIYESFVCFLFIIAMWPSSSEIHIWNTLVRLVHKNQSLFTMTEESSHILLYYLLGVMFLTIATGFKMIKNVAEEGSDIGVFQLLLEDECEDLRSEDCVPKDQKLPLERAKEAFYFQPLACYRDKPVWFSKQPVGKNKLEVVVKTVMGKAGIDAFYTNHSLRATTATRLFNANIPEQLIREQIGHRSNALWSYSRSSEPQKRKVSEILQLNEDSCTSIGPTVSKQATTSSSPTAAKQATNINVPIVSNPATTINAKSVPFILFLLKLPVIVVLFSATVRLEQKAKTTRKQLSFKS
ncbi:unnamed protein product [Mytilus coruscus]|uniref:Tyr recombinase domain-containing protein n=1 Tax=Mytilus coruscus TaxID=42192 RepID=A0A6J8ERI5_MYTCO|nr:unnamed protein product [Mytilus coruscus]